MEPRAESAHAILAGRRERSPRRRGRPYRPDAARARGGAGLGATGCTGGPPQSRRVRPRRGARVVRERPARPRARLRSHPAARRRGRLGPTRAVVRGQSARTRGWSACGCVRWCHPASLWRADRDRCPRPAPAGVDQRARCAGHDLAGRSWRALSGAGRSVRAAGRADRIGRGQLCAAGERGRDLRDDDCRRRGQPERLRARRPGRGVRVHEGSRGPQPDAADAPAWRRDRDRRRLRRPTDDRHARGRAHHRLCRGPRDLLLRPQSPAVLVRDGGGRPMGVVRGRADRARARPSDQAAV